MEIYIIVVFTAVGKPMLLKPAGVNSTVLQNTFLQNFNFTFNENFVLFVSLSQKVV